MKPQTQSLQSGEIDINLEHVQAELARIDVLIQRAVRHWQLAGQDSSDPFRGLHISDAEAETWLKRPFATSWGQTAPTRPEEERTFADALTQAERQAQSILDAAHRQGQTPGLERLAHLFVLDRFDLDALLVCLAPALDQRYEQLYGYLQNDVTRKRPTTNLLLDLLCKSGPTNRLRQLPRLADDAPLFRYHLLERVSGNGAEGLTMSSQPLCVDEAVLSWLLGNYRPHAQIGAYAVFSRPKQNQADVLLAERVQHELARLTDNSLEQWPVVVFFGPDQYSQQAAARLLAARLARPFLTLDLAAVQAADESPADAIRLALRDARLTDAILYLDGWDVCLTDGAPPPNLLAELCAFPGLLIVTGTRLWQAKGIARDRRLFWLEFPSPDYAQRHALWQHFLQPAAMAEGVDLDLLVGQFQLTSSQIRDAIASAQDIAAQRGSLLRGLDLLAAARAHSNPRLGGLARKISARFEWTDIILPEDQLTLLREIVSTVRGRPLVLDEWGVGEKLVSSAGVTVLFAGPPGTGKTMAAEIIAAELGLDLYKIDLSTIISKYIGETEKNLEQVFNEAQSSNAILFFDEADAIFGKRSEVKDAHDRYANIEISYLLQRMEAYDGVTILATNLRANLDEAFTRRLQFAVDFPFPEEEYRLRIWRTLFPASVPHSADIDMGLLAHRFKLAGGNIRNIIVSAAYLAAADGAQVTMRHLLHGARRELQKMGRLISEADMHV